MRKISAAALLCAGFALPSYAQNIDDAIQAYNDDKLEQAAQLFWEVKTTSKLEDERMKADYYLAHSLYKAGYYLAAYQFYGEVFNAGEQHRYFLKATEGLLKVAAEIHDDTLIPEILNRGYTQAFAQLKARELNSINYMIGMVSQRRGQYADAKNFLEAVGKKSPYYTRARYLLAIMSVRTATEQGADDYGTAIKYFQEIIASMSAASTDADKKIYRLALLGLARTYFSQGDFAKSVSYYEQVPRYSEDWYDAMFESGWAYFQNAQFGKALGMVQTIQSPYFDGRYRAESFVLKATVYFQMCHFDRVRRSLDVFFALYEKMSEDLNAFVKKPLGETELVALIQGGKDKRFPEEIRLKIKGNRRFQHFLAQVGEAETELAKAEKLPSSKMKTQLTAVLKDELQQRRALTGKLVFEQIRREAVFLGDFIGQAQIIKFETADAEHKMLTAGKDITKGPRARGPRPYVPNARYQYWAFNHEYWIDEIGFYQHSIKDECVDAVFE